MLAKFRHQYPHGSLVSELIKIDRGIYIVKALVEIDRVVLATALAGADTVETAEDLAKERAIATLFLDSHTNSDNHDVADNSHAPAFESQSKVVEAQPKPLEQPKVVNFSEAKLKSESEILRSQTPINHNHTMVDNTDSSPTKQPRVDDRVQELVQPAVAENNLFGDTFTAEIPEDISLDRPVDHVENQVSPISSEIETINFNEIKQKTDIEIKRLGWTKDQGKEFLMSHYGKRSRLHLTDEQLLEFLRYLEQLPNPSK